MCLMITEVIRFNTWQSFNRAIKIITTKYKHCLIHGQIFLPQHHTFKTWEEFYYAVKKVSEVGANVTAALTTLENNTPLNSAILKKGYPELNENDGLPGIYGEIHVEITDPWYR